MKQPIIIRITGFTTGGDPIMTSKGDVECEPGDTIQWMITKNIGTISAIRYKSGDYVFDSGPCPMGSSGNWKGVISGVIGTEKYTIVAAPPSPTAEAMPYDPQITVNPGKPPLNPENNPK